MRDAREGLTILTGETKRNQDDYLMNAEEQREFSNGPNRFYCRFERDDLNGELTE